MEKPGTSRGDGLDRIRTATQELHQAISDTLTKHANASKAEVESLVEQAKAAADSARSTMRAQHGAATKRQLTQAIDMLEAAEKHAAESLKSSGEAFHASLSKALADARISVQRISEAVAERRSEHTKQAGASKTS